ncbi:MAG TPA: MFS transporter [Candidatus Paceibacterota bacterium]|nr:MFS transporter [Verrucomicrobiota bacterium]HOX04570.1 MFS transporter [Verrucomicrobiota bacterium]HRZ47522.1 MFS transporter [Candidatus Paceibacterota bacterium]
MQTSQSNPSGGASSGNIFDGVTLYHWLVVIIASCGWLFDCMDQRLFILAREPALKELLGIHAATAANDPALLQSIATHAKSLGGWATACMMLGWAVGGIFFGMLSDRWGRVKTMAATLMVYSCFTGLSGIAHSPAEFLSYRFLVGLGVGGMFGAATTLVAESVPGRMRAIALGSLQALSATGNIMGSIISTQIPPSAVNLVGDYSGWRLLFFVGIIPSLLVIPILFILREPEAWKQAKAAAATGSQRNVGSLADLFRHPRWRHNAIIGLCLGVSGMIGLWGIGFFSPELVSEALKGAPQSTVDFVRSWGTALQDVGAFTGMVVFTFVASFVSRRTAFLGSFILCWIVVAFVFYSLKTAADAYWMLPMMGFATLSVFAGYSIYFPELFPTRLRGTGVGFCYNTVRFLTAPAPALFGYLTTVIPFRTTAIIMSSIYLLGIVALIWAPETKGKPLPED